MLTALVPKVFYADVEVGIDLFVDGIGLDVLYRDDDLVVVGRDHAKLYLVEDADFAAKDRPELAIETDDIEAVYADIDSRRADLLHPNLARIKRQPWGPREFALLDATTVCVIFRDWT
jgi:hypothetical protein